MSLVEATAIIGLFAGLFLGFSALAAIADRWARRKTGRGILPQDYFK